MPVLQPGPPMGLKEEVEEVLKKIITRETTRGSNGRFVYMKVLAGLRHRTENIEKIEQLREIKYVGERVYRRIASEMDTPDPALDSDSDSLIIVSSSIPAAEDTLDTVRLEDTTVPLSSDLSRADMAMSQPSEMGTLRRLEYVPAYRSTAYAVLRALALKDGSRKPTIVTRAGEYSDHALDDTHGMSISSAFNTLLRRMLIYKDESRRYYLTDTGREMCRRMGFEGDAPAEDDEVYMVIDNREKQGMKNRTYFQSCFSDLPAKTRCLGVGDFIWMKNGKIFPVVVERKSRGDFAASISDGRYKEQKRRIRRLFGRCFYIIEDMKTAGSNPELLQACLIQTKLEEGFVVIETRSIGESTRVLRRIDRWIRESGEDGSIGYGSFIEDGAKCVTVRDMLASSLLGIKGIGREKAMALAEHFGTLSNLLSRMTENGFAEWLSDFRVGNSRVGDAVAGEIMRMLGGSDENS